MKVGPLKVGPDSFQEWGGEIAEAINKNSDECAVRHFHGKAGSSDPGGGEGGEEGGPGGDGEIETVTGAVNGVPSTLNVLTDGAGWTAI